MPLYDHRCEDGHMTEAYNSIDQRTAKCSTCGKQAKRIPSVPKVCTFNNHGEWIRGMTRTAIDPDTSDPIERDMYKNPTRDKWDAWAPNNVVEGTKGHKYSKPEVNVERATTHCLKEHTKRHAIKVNS